MTASSLEKEKVVSLGLPTKQDGNNIKISIYKHKCLSPGVLLHFCTYFTEIHREESLICAFRFLLLNMIGPKAMYVDCHQLAFSYCFCAAENL